MSPVTPMGRIAWGISHNPKVWLPFVGIVIVLAIVLYFAFPSETANPMPRPEQVAGISISRDPSGGESTFKEVRNTAAYAQLREGLSGAWRARREPFEEPMLTLRIDKKDGTSFFMKFYDEGFVLFGKEMRRDRLYDGVHIPVIRDAIQLMEHGS